MRSLKGLTSVLLTLTLVLAITVSTGKMCVAKAASVDDLNKQKAELERQIQQAKQQAQQQKSVAQRAEEKLQELSGQITDVQQAIDGTQGTIDQTQQQIEDKNQEIARLQAEERKISTQQGALLRQMYIMSVSYTPDMMIFSNDDLSTRNRQQQQFEELQKSVQELIKKTNAAKLAVETSRGELVKKNNDLQSLLSQQSNQKNSLASMQDDQAALKDNAEAAVVQLEAKAKKALAQEASIEQQIYAAINAAVASKGKNMGPGAGGRVHRGDIVGHLGSTGNSTGPHVHFETRVNNKAVDPMPYVGSTLSWPVSNFTISQGFGWTSYAASGAYGGGIHTGIDLAGPYGQPVYAPADGIVILKQWYGGYGNAWAEQLDNGLVVLLGHMTGS